MPTARLPPMFCLGLHGFGAARIPFSRKRSRNDRISKLYCGTIESSDALRYERDSSKLPSHLLQFSKDKSGGGVERDAAVQPPLHPLLFAIGRHRLQGRTYHSRGSRPHRRPRRFRVPVLLFSGGEPLLRDDLLTLVAAARKRGIRAVISTNGTLITHERAASFRDAGLSYVGVSVDGLEDVHDRSAAPPAHSHARSKASGPAKRPASRWASALPSTGSTLKKFPACSTFLKRKEFPESAFTIWSIPAAQRSSLKKTSTQLHPRHRGPHYRQNGRASQKGIPAEVLTWTITPTACIST